MVSAHAHVLRSTWEWRSGFRFASAVAPRRYHLASSMGISLFCTNTTARHQKGFRALQRWPNTAREEILQMPRRAPPQSYGALREVNVFVEHKKLEAHFSRLTGG